MGQLTLGATPRSGFFKVSADIVKTNGNETIHMDLCNDLSSINYLYSNDIALTYVEGDAFIENMMISKRRIMTLYNEQQDLVVSTVLVAPWGPFY